jgi:hypothetical protein
MNYYGMTVNERLFRSGLLKDFDAAIARKDVKRVVEILKSVELDDESIQANLEFFGLESNARNQNGNEANSELL